MKPHILTRLYPSPAGDLLLGAVDNRLCMCDWTAGARHANNCLRLQQSLSAQFRESTSQVIELAIKQLDEYFAGVRRTFSLPLLPVGTSFQRRVLQLLSTISYGATSTYGRVAHRLGNAKGVRAVAQAIACNPLSIFVPCHRVVGADGSLRGYNGGVEAKRLLLTLEATHLRI